MSEQQLKEIQVIEQKAVDVIDRANSLVVTNQDQYNGCAEFLRSIKVIKKEIDATFDEPIKKAHEAHKAIVASKKKHYEPLDRAEKIVKEKSITWYQEEERKTNLERLKKQAEADKAEEKRKADLEEQAKGWDAKGNTEKAEERRQQAEEVVVPVAEVEDKAQKAEGQSISVTWKAEVVDLFALCNTIARGDLPETVVQPVMKELNNLARTWKDKKKFDGVKFTAVQNMSVRA